MAAGEVAIAVDNMAKKPEATPVADNPKEKVASKTDYPNSNQTTENCATGDVDAKKSKLAAQLTQIFIASRVFGVLLDPLFLYIPLLNQDLKCLRLDNTVTILALVSRSCTDLFYVGRIILQICRFKNCSPFIKNHLPQICSFKLMTSLIKSFGDLLPEVTELHVIPSITEEILESSILLDIFAVLPLPQVATLIFFPRMRFSGSFSKHIMNYGLMVQYAVRIFYIYQSSKVDKRHIPLRFKTMLSFFLFVATSHVLGGFWYFFAAQQMISCWEHACRYGNGCGATTFNCHDHQTLRNITVLNDFCPINPPDSTLFDFGIYLNVLQSGALWSTDSLKFFNGFCWGLRNLSSFASNLQPSFYTGEIGFVAYISIFGVTLFVFLIGNMQTIDTERRKINEIERKVETWLSGHGIPLNRKQKIMEAIREHEGSSDFDVVTEILSILPRDEIESCSPLSRLRKVPLLQDMDEEVLLEISAKLKPERYTPEQIIIERDKTFEKMLFIVDGHVTIENIDGSRLKLGAENFYGEKLLVSSSWTSSEDAKPLNDESVQAIDHVQALVLYATDMASMSSKARWHFNNLLLVTMLQKVPKLQTMDDPVLKAMSELNSEKRYKRNDYIVREDQPLSMMFFVTSGKVTRNENHPEVNFFGEELVEWVLDDSFPAILPLSTCTVKVESDDARVLILKADRQLKNVASKFRSQFSGIASPSDVRLTWLKEVPKLHTMDEQVLKAMSKLINSQKRYKLNDCIVREGEPLSMMFFVTRGKVTRNENVTEANFFGEELVEWVLDDSFPAILPLSTCTVKVESNDAQVLILKADRQLKKVASKFMSHFKGIASPSDVRVTWLKKVEIFQKMEEQVLEAISKFLEPMNFNVAKRLNPTNFNVAKRHILQEKKPLEMMFFVNQGVVLIESDSAMDVSVKKTWEMGSFYGEELVHWVTTWVHKSFPAELPLSPGSALYSVHGGPVEILALKADNLKSIVFEFRSKFSTEAALATDSDQPRDPLTILKNVERLETMDEEVLKEICKHLTEKTYKDEYIILKDKQMEMMFFIVSGVVSVTNESSKHYRNGGGRPNHSGVDLIVHWLQSKSTSVPADLPTSPFSFWAIGEVEVLVLTADDLAKVQRPIGS